MAITATIGTTRTLYFTDVVSEFDGSQSTTDDPLGITDYEWDFGDATIMAGTDSSGWHRYVAVNPSITVTLTVTNSLLETDQTTLVINVIDQTVDTTGQLRRYITQFMDVFNGLTVTNKDGTDIQVPLVWGNPDRVVAYIRGEIGTGELKNAVSLPIMSGRLAGLSPDYSRSKYNYHSRSAYDPAEGTSQQLWYPTPVTIDFELGLWTMDYGQAFSLMETIVPWFNSALVINTGAMDYTSMNNLELIDISDQNIVDLGGDRRLVRYDMNFELKGYLPPNRKVNDIITRAFVETTVHSVI